MTNVQIYCQYILGLRVRKKGQENYEENLARYDGEQPRTPIPVNNVSTPLKKEYLMAHRCCDDNKGRYCTGLIRALLLL